MLRRAKHIYNSRKTNMKIVFLTIFALLILQSCQNKPNFEQEKQAIMTLHNKQQKAHLEKDAFLLMGDSGPDFIEINRGAIKKPRKEESIKKFQSYFDAVEFVKWDDIGAPVFSFSDDATMATTVVNKIVITKQKNENNRLDTAYYAWLAVYQKTNGQWQLQTIASTNK